MEKTADATPVGDREFDWYFGEGEGEDDFVAVFGFELLRAVGGREDGPRTFFAIVKNVGLGVHPLEIEEKVGCWCRRQSWGRPPPPAPASPHTLVWPQAYTYGLAGVDFKRSLKEHVFFPHPAPGVSIVGVIGRASQPSFPPSSLPLHHIGHLLSTTVHCLLDACSAAPTFLDTCSIEQLASLGSWPYSESAWPLLYKCTSGYFSRRSPGDCVPLVISRLAASSRRQSSAQAPPWAANRPPPTPPACLPAHSFPCPLHPSVHPWPLYPSSAARSPCSGPSRWPLSRPHLPPLLHPCPPLRPVPRRRRSSRLPCPHPGSLRRPRRRLVLPPADSPPEDCP
eukprot:scaffold3587_cov109-Isochrysis_galbana.AAC.8